MRRKAAKRTRPRPASRKDVAIGFEAVLLSAAACMKSLSARMKSGMETSARMQEKTSVLSGAIQGAVAEAAHGIAWPGDGKAETAVAKMREAASVISKLAKRGCAEDDKD